MVNVVIIYLFILSVILLGDTKLVAVKCEKNLGYIFGTIYIPDCVDIRKAIQSSCELAYHRFCELDSNCLLFEVPFSRASIALCY